ncbi:MAG: helix-turn-helix transcriptional regulator [Pseudomonadota bacterium]
MTSLIDQHLGKRIAAAREQLGIEFDRLSDVVDVPVERLMAFEQGSTRIPAASLSKLAKALGVTPRWFFHGLPGQDAFDRTG